MDRWGNLDGLKEKIVEVYFYDHVENARAVVGCHVWGRLIGVTDKDICLCVWEGPDHDNSSFVGIVKAAISCIHELKHVE